MNDEIIDFYLQVSTELCDGKEWCWSGVGEPLRRFAELVIAAHRGDPVATIFMDQHGREQIEFITTIPVGGIIRLYAEPLLHSPDLLLVAKMVRDECHKAWVSSWENFRSDVDLNKIIGAVLEKNSRFAKSEELKGSTR